MFFFGNLLCWLDRPQSARSRRSHLLDVKRLFDFTTMIASKYPKVGHIRADSISVIVTWFFMGLTGALWLLQAVGMYALRPAVNVALWTFFLAAGVHVVLAFLHKCPSCSKHPTIQGFKRRIRPSSASLALKAGRALR
jgi:hypothetical protein